MKEWSALRERAVRNSAAAVLVLLAMAVWNARAANLVQNGSFEGNPALTGWTVSGDVFGLGAGTGFPRSGFRSVTFSSADEFSFLSQTLSTSVGQTYLLSFWISNDEFDGEFIPNEFVVQWGGAMVTNLVDFVFPDYINVRLQVTASANSTVLTFGGMNVPATIYLDDITVTPLATIAGRHIFYNNSAWDGNNAGPNSNDDAAIAPDKVALLPGGTARFTNYTSYSKGINGIMVDIVNLAGIPTVTDITFRVGNNSSPGGWSAAPLPTAISIRAGAGVGGSDRVTLIWPDNAIQKQWLQVTVLATPNTGLATPDVFYFGNAIGESGSVANNAQVDLADEIDARNHPRNFVSPAPIDYAYDYDRNRIVDLLDEIIARNNPANFVTALQLISPPAAGAPSAFVKSIGRNPVMTIRRDGFGCVIAVGDAGAGIPKLEATEGFASGWADVSVAPAIDADTGVWHWRLKALEGTAQQFFRVRFEPDAER